MAALFIEEIVGKLKRGELRIPAFQRGFVWSPEDVAFLMDSIYKSYPFGSVLLWRTKVKLTQERDLGPFKVPEPTADYPIDYVLDGQQRLTSILGVFATGLARSNTVEFKDIYFDLSAPDHSQTSQFYALDASETDPSKHLPLNIIFDSVKFRHATVNFSEDLQQRADVLQKRFQQAQFPCYMVEAEEIDTIAIVFERINRKGIPLDTFQLLTAWTWSEEFELRQQFEELAGELEPFGFKDVGEDTELILRCAAAVLIGRESAESLLSITGATVRNGLPSVKKGLKASLDFLKQNLPIQKLDNLPYPTSLIPLTAFFAGPEDEQLSLTDVQHRTLVEWFWRTLFSHRYSSGTKRSLETDIREAKKLRDEGASNLGNFDATVPLGMFSERRFLTSSVDTKTFVLMLVNQRPKSLVSGADVQVGRVLTAGNRSEFHHLFPQAYLKANGVDPAKIGCLANFCVISASDNKKIGGKQPSSYRSRLSPSVVGLLASHLVPESLFNDNFDTFVEERSRYLVAEAYRLMGRPQP
ncbi:MAG: DUF262 domain-containing protein [Aliidongia sp.]